MNEIAAGYAERLPPEEEVPGDPVVSDVTDDLTPASSPDSAFVADMPPQRADARGAGPARNGAGAERVSAGAGSTPGKEGNAASEQGSASESLEELASAVLDSAEVANQSARAAAKATGNLLDSADRLDRVTVRNQRNSVYVLGVSAAVVLISMVIFVVIAVMMNSRIKRVDSMLAGFGARVASMNTGITNLQTIADAVNEMRQNQLALRETQTQLEKKMDAVVKATQTLGEELPIRAATEVGTRNAGLATKVEGFEKSIAAQKKALSDLERNMKSLSSSVGGLAGKMGSVERLNSDVSALVVLQKERYLETIQKEQKKNQKPAEEKFVTYGRTIKKDAKPAPEATPAEAE